MAGPTVVPSNADFDLSSIDGLMALDTAAAPNGGAGPFVINLAASGAPIDLKDLEIPAGDYVVYQIQRMEDGRARYRLRIGPFEAADAVDAMLTQMRSRFPTALSATVAADDLHAIERGRAKSAARAAPPPAALAPARAAVASAVGDVAAAVQPPVLTLELELEPEPGPPARTPMAVPPPVERTTARPALARSPDRRAPVAESPLDGRVAPAVTRPDPERRVATAERRALPAAGPASRPSQPEHRVAPPSTVAPERRVIPTPATVGSAPRSAVVAPPTKTVPAEPTHDLESTRTVRSLTLEELGDEGGPRWFIVELTSASAPFDPDHLPNLDIFSLYRLYTVVALDQGRSVHSLRLGFFGEEMPARAVANYLAGYYKEAKIKRVSVAERDRFADQSFEARKDIGATGRYAAIEITDELTVRERRRMPR